MTEGFDTIIITIIFNQDIVANVKRLSNASPFTDSFDLTKNIGLAEFELHCLIFSIAWFSKHCKLPPFALNIRRSQHKYEKREDIYTESLCYKANLNSVMQRYMDDNLKDSIKLRMAKAIHIMKSE